MTLNRATIERMVGKIVRLLETKCIALNGVRPNWQALFAEAVDDICRSTTQQEFEARVSEALNRGGLSHVAFFHETGQRAPARYAINATFTATEEKPARWTFQ